MGLSRPAWGVLAVVGLLLAVGLVGVAVWRVNQEASDQAEAVRGVRIAGVLGIVAAFALLGTAVCYQRARGLPLEPPRLRPPGGP